MGDQPKQPSLPGIVGPIAAPKTEDDWFAKRIEMSELFSPTEPVRETDLFAGRTQQIFRLIEVVFQGGQHAVIFGERGVGKTSLANTFKQKIFPTSSRVRLFSTQCYQTDDYADIWTRVFGKHVWKDGDYAFDDIDDAITPHDLGLLMKKFGPTVRPVFIFDEFDRINDASTKLQMAETLKLFSDECPEITVIIVGIGRTIRELLEDHQSVRRAIKPVEMPRMTPDEVMELVSVRVKKLGMAIEEDALSEIVGLCRGMPGYAHLLGLNSGKAAIDRKCMVITSDHLEVSLDACIEDAGEIIRQDYAAAVQSPQPGNLLKQALLACALAEQDEFGSFSAASVRDPYTRIMKSQRDIPDFNRHLKAFCSKPRGGILERFGTPKNYRYRFKDAVMQCYVVIKGRADRLIADDEAN